METMNSLEFIAELIAVNAREYSANTYYSEPFIRRQAFNRENWDCRRMRNASSLMSERWIYFVTYFKEKFWLISLSIYWMVQKETNRLPIWRPILLILLFFFSFFQRISACCCATNAQTERAMTDIDWTHVESERQKKHGPTKPTDRQTHSSQFDVK